MRTKLSLLRGMVGALAVVCCMGPVSALAGVLETQSNPVQGDFAATENWTNAVNWNALPRYPADPVGDTGAGEPDWFYSQVAHTNDFFFIRYHNSHPFGGGRQLMYFDTDSDRNTGLPGFSNLAIGAEYYLDGAALRSCSGSTFESCTFHDFIGWNNQQDGNGEWDIMIAIDRSGAATASIPGVTSFNFVNQDREFSDDWYPDGGDSGAGGDFFRYEAAQPTVQAFGRTWNVFEPVHRDNPALAAEVTGAANELALTGVFGSTGPLWDTRALTPLTVEVGTKVSYTMAITNDQRDPIGDGPSNYIGDAFGVFSTSGSDPSNANLVSIRTGVAGGANPPGRIQYNDIALGELGFASLESHPVEDGVRIEWLFTSPNAAEISVHSPDGGTLLGLTYIDEIEEGISSIQGFRFNLFDSEQTMTISNFLVEQDAFVPGDYNRNGIVDAADYTVWRDSIGQVGLGLRADGTGPGLDGIPDGVVDANDYDFWTANFGNVAGSSAAASSFAGGAVPEPSSLALGGMLLALVAVGRRRMNIFIR